MILAKKYSLPLWLLFFYLFTIVSTSCAEKEFHEFSGETMGTNYTIKYSAKLSNQSNNKSKVDQLLEDINNQMSTYISDSEISRFNTFNDTTWFAISDEFAYVIASSFVRIGILFSSTTSTITFSLKICNPLSKKNVCVHSEKICVFFEK